MGEQKCFERSRHVLWIVGIENRYSKIRWGWLGWLKNTHERQRMGEEEKKIEVVLGQWVGVESCCETQIRKSYGVETVFLGGVKIF